MRLVLLRQHPVLGLEVMPGVGDQLRVARMIDGFDAGDDLRQPGSVLVDMLDQFVFGIGRPGDQNRAGVRTIHYVSPSVWAWRRERIGTIEYTLLAGDNASRFSKIISLGDRKVGLDLELARAKTNSARVLNAGPSMQT